MNFSLGRKLGLVVVLMAALALVVPVSAQDATPATITVTGTGTVYAAPNIAYLQLGVETVNPDLGAAFGQTGQTVSNVIQSLTGLGIAPEDIQTSNVSVSAQDQYDPAGNPTGQRTYHVSNIVQVTIRDIAQVQPVLTSAVAAGANTIYGLSFGLKSTDGVESRARRLAVNDAKKQAEDLATLVELTLGAPQSVTEIPQIGGTPVPYAKDVAGLASNPTQPISVGQVAITVQVEISYRIGA